MEFKDQYKHPNWQKKRLEVLDYFGFSCQSCESEDKTVHVHHRRYIKNRMVWDYPVTNFDVLCEKCHAETHVSKDLLMEVISTIPSNKIEYAACLLAGWASEFDNDDIEDRCSDRHAYEAGYFSLLAGNYSVYEISELINTSPDVIRWFINSLKGNLI